MLGHTIDTPHSTAYFDSINTRHRMHPMKALFLASLFAFAVHSSTHGSERPNFIFFIADDISQDDFGCYGHPVIDLSAHPCNLESPAITSVANAPP